MIIDFHTHAFPDAVAPRAMDKLSFVSGGLIPYTDGTAEGLLSRMREDGVDLSVVLSIATNPHQQRAVNDFAAALNEREGLVAFGSVHPDAPDAMEELERIADMGLRGVKLHPDYQGFSVDEDRMIPLYKNISSLGLITVFHAGVDYGFSPPYGATPEKMARALRHIDSPVVAAHLGGVGCYTDVLRYLCGENLYFDTAFTFSMLPKYYAEKIIEAHGTDNILFGTDCPWHTAALERRLIETLSLSDEDKEKIYSGNAKRLLGI